MRFRHCVSARWVRHAAVLAVLLAPLAAIAQESVKVQATQRSFNDAYRQEDWERAINLGLELVTMVPDRPLAQYNLACVYALSGDGDSALHWLGRAAASGFWKLSFLDQDPDLEIVHDRRGYASVRAVVADNQHRRRLEVRQIASGSPPLIVVPEGIDPDQPAPLIIALHGYGDHAENYPKLWGGAAERMGAILAVPFGTQKVGDGRGWEGVDEADAVLELTLEQVKESYEVDDEQIVLTGFSQGGFMAMALGVRHPELFVGVIPMAGGYIREIDLPPVASDGDPRYYFLVGARDPAVDEVRRAAGDFKAAGYEVKLRAVSGTGHAFPRATRQELGKALRFVLNR
jgi:phospholipase/carboxylesterase